MLRMSQLAFIVVYEHWSFWTILQQSSTIKTQMNDNIKFLHFILHIVWASNIITAGIVERSA